MIHVYLHGATEPNLKAIEAMLGSVEVKPHFYKVHDLAAEKAEIGKNRNMIAFGKKAIHELVTAMVTEGLISKGVYVGKPLVDEGSAFFFYGIHMDIPEIMRLDENKDFVYSRLIDMAKYYFEWSPLNDNFNFTSDSPDDVAQLTEQSSEDVVQKSEEALATVEYGIEVPTIDTIELINKLIEKVDFSDAGLGKSLAKFDKIQLQTNNGFKINVSPTARESASSVDKEIDITYKDLLSLLKVIILTGSRSIEFFKGE